MSWLIPFNELTVDQQRAVQLNPNENRAIIGGPGSGKTQVLLHRARYLSDLMGTSPEGYRLFVYTNALKEYIKSAIQDLRLPEDNVLTFDHWCCIFYQQHINKSLPRNSEEKTLDFPLIRKSVIRYITSGKISLPIFNFVLVDEGQDFEEEIFSFLSSISRHVTVCIDNKQQLYDNKASEVEILYKLGIRRHNVNLIDAFRVCPYLVEVAAEFIPDPTEKDAFRNQTRQPQIERQTPSIYFSRNLEDEKQMLYHIVQERLLKNERIAILLPKNKQVFGFAKGLSDVGIEVEVPDKGKRSNSLPTHDFNSSRPKVMAYHSAKGLTFDTVIMPRLVASSFGRFHPSRIERLIFVGITRATKWCYFSTTLDNPLSLILDKILPLVKSRKVSILQSEDQWKSKDSEDRKKEKPGKKDDLDFL